MHAIISRIAFWRPPLGEVELEATGHVYRYLRRLPGPSRERVLRHVREILADEGGYYSFED